MLNKNFAILCKQSKNNNASDTTRTTHPVSYSLVLCSAPKLIHTLIIKRETARKWVNKQGQAVKEHRCGKVKMINDFWCYPSRAPSSSSNKPSLTLRTGLEWYQFIRFQLIFYDYYDFILCNKDVRLCAKTSFCCEINKTVVRMMLLCCRLHAN